MGIFRLIGGIFGAIFGGPLGAAIGWGIGGLVDSVLNPRKISGPRLDDLLVQTSTEGANIPRIWGTFPLAGNVIWSTEKLQEIKNTKKVGGILGTGIGATKVTTWTYYGWFQIAICEGPITGIRRIWADGNLVYTEAAGATDAELAASAKFAKYFQVFLGTETQNPDTQIIAKQPTETVMWGGLASLSAIPAYRGMAYVSFYGLPLVDYGNRIPTLKFEVIGAGTRTGQVWEEITPLAADHWGPRSMAGTCVIEDKMFIIGGWNPPPGDSFSDLWYSVNGSTWMQKASMPLGGRYYVGRFEFQPVVAYDATLGWLIFVYGGASDTGNVPLISSGPTNAIIGFRYVIDDDAWAEVLKIKSDDSDVSTTPPWPRRLFSSCYHNGKAYIAGGRFTTAADYPSAPVDYLAEHCSNEYFKDIYESSNGLVFVHISGALGTFLPRTSAALVSHKGDLYILGGDVTNPGIPGSQRFKNACYKFTDTGSPATSTFTRTAIDVTAFTHNISSAASFNVVAKTLKISGDHAARFTTGKQFMVYDSINEATGENNAFGAYECASNATYAGGLTTITITGDFTTAKAAWTSTMYLSLPFFSALPDADPPQPASPTYWPDQGDVWGAVSWGDYLVAFIQAAGGYLMRAVYSSDGGVTWGELLLTGTIPGFNKSGGDPYPAFASFIGRMWIMGGEENAASVIDEIHRSTLPTLAADTIYLDSVVADVCEEAGLAADEINVTDLAAEEVPGCSRTGRESGRDTLQKLFRAYFVDAVETGWVIAFLLRAGKTSAATIANDDLGAHGASEEAPPPIEIQRVQDLELPEQIDVSYFDAARDYQQGTQSARRILGEANEKQSVELPLVLTANSAALAAHVLLWDAWAQRETVAVVVGMRHLTIDPADLITINYGAETYIIRVTKIEFSPYGLIRISGVIEDLSIYTADIDGVQGGGETSGGLKYLPASTAHLLDIPILQANHEDGGFYFGAAPADGRTDLWPGADLWIQYKTRKNWDFIGQALAPSVVGASIAGAGGILAAGTTYTLDYSGSVTVALTSGTLESAEVEDVLAGVNWFLLGNEIIGVVTATDLGSDQYLLSTLLRGLYATDLARDYPYGAVAHAASERFVSLDALERIPESHAMIGIKAVTRDESPDSVDAISFTNQWGGYQPYPVDAIRGQRNRNGSWRIDWNPRVNPAEKRDRFKAYAARQKYYLQFHWPLTGTITASSRLYIVGPETFLNYSADDQEADFLKLLNGVRVRIQSFNGIWASPIKEGVITL